MRNSSYKATSGSKTTFYQQLPIVSGNNEITNTIVYTKYKTLSRSSDLVGKASLYFKAVNSLDDSAFGPWIDAADDTWVKIRTKIARWRRGEKRWEWTGK